MKIFIFTSKYPYPHHEQFLHNEVESKYMQDHEIIFVPLYHKGENKTYKKVIDYRQESIFRKIGSVFIALCSLLSSRFAHEFLSIIKSKKVILRLNHLVKFTLKSEYVYQLVFKRIRDEITDNSILYSYWLYTQSYIVSKISTKLNTTSISRAHGFDLYESRNNGNYIPYRDYILKNLSKVYFISENGLIHLSRLFSNYSNKFLVNRLGTLDNGIQSYENSDSFSIVSCSWVVPVKRIDLIIEALCNIKAFQVKWTHIGDGPDLDKLKKHTSNLPLNIHYEFKGRLTSEQVYQFYRNNCVDLFINTSASEGVPVSIMEAMSFGIPIIATDVGGSSEIVKQDYNGFLLDKNFAPVELSDLIVKYSKLSREVLVRYRCNSRLVWEQLCNLNANVREFSDEISKISKI